MRKFTQLLLWAIMASIALPATAETFIGDRTDFRDETIYFAITTRFYDGDPTNNVCSWDKQDVQISKNDPDWRGDFKGLIDKLDYIKALGFTAVWITPIVQNASGEDYHGYHSMDFSSVDLRYESRKEWGASQDVKFQDLIDAAHAKGIKIVLDIVLQHTSNFGEAYLNPLFTRDQNIKNQGSPAGALIPNERLSSNYFDQTGTEQYNERWKYFKQAQYEPNNYYHHYGTGWNWDDPSRWWGQIAGDCVDLNTENDYVAEYIVDCYSKFIAMGVDAFRIDTTGHIARLTFNKQFIPQFHAVAEQYRSKRLNGGDFYMFGECCARYSDVTYRDQPNLSSYFYTWKSPQSLLDQYNGDPEWWKTQVLNEGHDNPVGPMAVCESETEFTESSDNVFMLNGQWHEPDYSNASGLNVIDFPMHYNFNNAAAAVNVAKSGDKYYNDASYNVVYVDSHDYCPGPNDGTRFNGGTAQWAENLSLMFTFRGIPCIFYGSEVEFKAGKPIDVGGENNKTPRSESGRAYFGTYLEGNVTASDFGVYTADGNVAQTLDGDLAHHIRRLNMIRAAVPALRRGQYTWDGCTADGGWAFKRAYKDESYALVAINGGATFTDVPSGTYVDVVTGQSYTPSNGTITVTAPQTQGQLRVLVKDWTGGKIGDDGKFIYTTSAVAHGGAVSFDDPGATRYYTADDVVGRAKVTFSPNGGTFKSETLTVSASLNEVATSGWYQIADGSRVTISQGETKTFTIGEDMDFGESVTVTWGATDESGEELSGSVSFKKVDPNATITVYVKSASAPYFYAWCDNSDGVSVEPNGAWPGQKMSETVEIGGETYYFFTFDDTDSANFILSNGTSQTGDITGITEDVFYEYDGSSTATRLTDVVVTPVPSVTFSPNGGNFTEEVNVTVTVKNATSAWYKINDGDQVDINGSTTTFTLGEDYSYDTPITVSWSATDGTATKTGSVTFTRKQQGAEPEYYVYLKNTANWSEPYVWAWVDNGPNCTDAGKWPGDAMTQEGDLWKWVLPDGKDVPTLIIFSNNGSSQTGNMQYVNGATYDCSGAIVDGDDPTPTDGFWVYFDNSNTNWTTPYIYFWGGASSIGWPGTTMTKIENDIWGYQVPAGTTNIIFNIGSNKSQTEDFDAVENGLYDFNDLIGQYSGVTGIETDDENVEEIYYNLQGIRVDNPTNGFYILRKGSKVSKVYVR